jgi:asparagine synthase (glutamine-hydrolysing)
MARHSNQPVKTFSIGFNEDSYNELKYARIAAKHFATDHHEFIVTPDICQVVDELAWHFDEPFADPSALPTYMVSKLARAHVTVALSGDGGDELFGGNSRYVDDRVFQQYHSIPLWVRRFCIEPAVSTGSEWTHISFFDRASRYIRRSNINVPDRLFSYSLLSSVPGADLFTPDFMASIDGHDPLAPARHHFQTAPAHNDLNRWLYLDMKMTIGDNDLRKVTVMSRLAGVTARYPMLEPALAEFTGTIPADLKIRKTQLRYLFKKAMSGILPPEIISKTKHGFGLPYCVWLGE